MNSSSSRKSAGWIVALRIVVAAFVTLAAAGIVLLPIFGRAVDNPRLFRCQNNIKEMAVAVLLYQQDYDSKLPSSMLVSHSKKWSRADFLKFATMRGQLPPKGKRQTYAELLHDYVPTDDDITFCPSDAAGDNKGPNTQISYWWKLAVDKAWYGEGCSKTYRKADDYPRACDQIILYEHAGFHSGGDSLKNGVEINVAYLDSHVKRLYIKNATSGDPKNCAANDDGEPMYFNYDFKRNRGLSSDSVPARYVDPGVYADRL